MHKKNRPLGLAVVLVLVVLVVLAGARPGAAAGARAGREVASFQEVGPVNRTWGWILDLWKGHNPVKSLTRVWGKMGPIMDPNGATAKPGTGSSSCTTTACPDVGPLIDPDGGR